MNRNAMHALMCNTWNETFKTRRIMPCLVEPISYGAMSDMKQGVSRRPKNLVSYKPEQSAEENDGNDENIAVEGNDNEVQDFKLLKMLQ